MKSRLLVLILLMTGLNVFAQQVPSREVIIAKKLSEVDSTVLILLNAKKITLKELKALNPASIASIDVLKNGITTSAYGTGANNGVVMISTKSLNFNNEIAPFKFIPKNAKQPLYIVDGQKYPKVDLIDVLPENIESINILKDSNAVALFGPEGSDGVIVIVTKTAKKIEEKE